MDNRFLNAMSGKGDKPRGGYNTIYRSNYDEIDWHRDNTGSKNTNAEEAESRSAGVEALPMPGPIGSD